MDSIFKKLDLFVDTQKLWLPIEDQANQYFCMGKSWSQGALSLFEEIVTDVDFYGRENQSTLRVWSLVGWPFSGWPNIHSSVDNTYHTLWIIYLKKKTWSWEEVIVLGTHKGVGRGDCGNDDDQNMLFLKE